MRKSVERVLRLALWPFGYLKAMSLPFIRRSCVVRTGLLHTYRVRRPCRPDGTPLPWMNYNVIGFLEERLSSDLRVFEYGSGYSTIFFARLVKDVVSVEHEKKWFERMSGRLPKNAKLVFCERDRDGRYCRMIKEVGGRYDVVVVDGRDRVNCVIQAFDCLSERGVVVLDDSSRERYRAAIDFLLSKGFRKLDFEGMKPTAVSVCRTTIFYRQPNCVGV